MNRLRTLVVYYAPYTEIRDVALDLAFDLDADLMEVCRKRPERGFIGRLRTFFEDRFNLACETLPFSREPLLYDLILIGLPADDNCVSGPIRAFLSRSYGRMHNVGFFVTHSGLHGQNVLHQLSTLARQQQLAAISVNRRAVQSGAYLDGILTFESELSEKIETVRFIQSGWPTVA